MEWEELRILFLKKMIKFSLVIPCYNEENNLPLLIKACKNLLEDPHNELIIVNNGSTDNSSLVLKHISEKHSKIVVVNIKKNIGYGHGILSGLRAANGNILGWTHADLQTNPNDCINALGFFNVKHSDNIFVKGKRYGRPLADSFFTFAMSVFESILLKKKLWDINAQPTIFTRKFYDKFSNPPNDFSLDLYVYFLALKYKMRVHRFNVFFGKRAYGVSHWNIDYKSKIKFIKRTLKYSIELRKNIL